VNLNARETSGKEQTIRNRREGNQRKNEVETIARKKGVNKERKKWRRRLGYKEEGKENGYNRKTI
jgi:hypothetical protein